MANESWRREALEQFPELAERAERWETPYLLWFDLRDAFETEYRKPSRNEQLIRRIYEFAEWCVKQPQSSTAAGDLATCVSACFYEHIPQTAEALKEMPRWIPRSTVLQMKEIFTYHTGEGGFQEILQAYDDAYQKKVLGRFPAQKRR